MSRKKSGSPRRSAKRALTAEIKKSLARCGGSHDTRKERERSAEKFGEFIREEFGLHSLLQVGSKHLWAYADDLRSDGIEVGRAQNVFAHIRKVLIKAGRADLIAHPHTSNESLGIGGRNRDGVRDAIEQSSMAAFRDAARDMEPGVAIAIELCWLIGLRVRESVMCMRSLAEWEHVIARGTGPYMVAVTHGTKGGRVRETFVLDRDRTLDVVRRARACAARHGGFLIPGSREQAMTRFYTVAAAIGMVGRQSAHGLRYGYATRYLEALLDEGISEDEALRRVANALGHGHGRKSWVKSVYCRALLAAYHARKKTLAAPSQ